jgi:hypothetical protein
MPASVKLKLNMSTLGPRLMPFKRVLEKTVILKYKLKLYSRLLRSLLSVLRGITQLN